MLLEHERRGHHDRAELGQRGGDEPELVVAAQDDHDHVAPADALSGEEVRGLVRPALHLAEREEVLLPFGIAPHHGAAVGIIHGDVVDDVVAEIEILRAVDLEGFELAVCSVAFLDEAQIDVSHVIGFLC